MDWLIHYCIAEHVWIFVQSYDMIMIWFQLPGSSLCVGNEKESMNQWMILVTKHMSLPDMIFQNTGATKKTIITLSILACHHTFFSLSLTTYLHTRLNQHAHIACMEPLEFQQHNIKHQTSFCPRVSKRSSNSWQWVDMTSMRSACDNALVIACSTCEFFEFTDGKEQKIIQWYYSGIRSSWSSSVFWYRCLCYCDCS